MKNVLILGLLCAALSSCSLLERRQNSEDEHEVAENEESAPPLESEVARLNAKISALETKLDVLSTSMDRMQMQKSQPVIQAEPDAHAVTPQANMAAPVSLDNSAEEQPQIHATEAPAHELPTTTKSISAAPLNPAASSEAEKEFRSAMTLFQNGKNLESATKFASLAKKYPQHLLASHALYWAGEAGARAQQWSLAAGNWEELETRYPRSVYLPEALAGLARAYENQGDTGKSRSYRDNLLRSFPKSPVAMNFSNQSSPSKPPRASYSSEEENAPAYEGNSGSQAASASSGEDEEGAQE